MRIHEYRIALISTLQSRTIQRHLCSAEVTGKTVRMRCAFLITIEDERTARECEEDEKGSDFSLV
jgi:hypothetical protein